MITGLTGIRIALFTGVVLAVSVPTTAWADENGPSDEIVVTARKRVESILRVPVIESVLTRDMIERAQIREITDLTTKVNSFLVGANTPDVGAQITIRGVGNTTVEPGVDSSTSMNIDGLQLTHGTAFESALFDLSQIEILKGPQALFYGKSSPAGVISVRTADPGDELEVMARMSHEFVANDWRGEAVLSAPLGPTLGVRLAALHSQSDDYFKNEASYLPATGGTPVPSGYGQTKTTFVRGTVLFRPSPDFTARLKLNYAQDKLNGTPPRELASCPEGVAGYANAAGLTAVPFIDPRDDCKLGRSYFSSVGSPQAYPLARNDAKEFNRITQKFGTLELTGSPAESISLTSVTGYYRSDLDSLFNSGAASYAASGLESERYFYRKEFMQEVRLNSDWGGPFDINLGAFYQRGRMFDQLRTNGNVIYGFPPILANRSHRLKVKSFSAFGQALYRPVASVEIAAGARWTSEQRSDYVTTISGTTVLHPTVPDLSTKNWSPELTISYSPSADMTVFASLKQGYKSGSYAFVNVTQGQDNSFKDEKVQGGEIGLKTRLADRQVSLNLSGYYYVYKDLQVGTVVAPPGGGLPQTQILNAANSKTYGIDFDLAYRPASVPGLNLRTAIAWNHARFSKFETAPCWGGQSVAEGCDRAINPVTGLYTAQDLSGARLVRAPTWQLTAAAEYETALSPDLRGMLDVDVQFSSKYLTNLGRRADFFQKGFAKLNARLGIGGSDEDWTVELLGKNLTNKYTANSCSNSNAAGGLLFGGVVTGGTIPGVGGIDEVGCYVDRGREVTLRLTIRR